MLAENDQMGECEVIENQLQPISEDVDFYHTWALEARKKVVDVTNEALKQTLTLATALCGGSFFLSNDKLIPAHPALRTAATVAFLLAVVVAFIGSLPVGVIGVIDQPYTFRDGVNRAIAQKNCFLRVAGGLIAVGFLLALWGVLVWAPGGK